MMSQHHNDGPDLFVVIGTVTGQRREQTVRSPADALALMVSWLRVDRAASAVWFLHPAWPETVTAVCRWRPTIPGIRQSRCVAHCILFQPGHEHGAELTAWCGKGLLLHTVEWLNPGQGMPCTGCLMLTSPAPPAGSDIVVELPPARRHHERRSNASLGDR